MTIGDANSSTSERVCQLIEQEIAEGVYEDGIRLDEARLSAQFSVSRTPLREAFRMLAALGLVELIPHRGAFVRLPSFTRLVDMFDVMAEMEAWCARLAAQRITNAQLLMLRAAANGCADALSRNDTAAYYEENALFHDLIYQASGNAFLAEETRNLQRRLRLFRKEQLSHGDRLTASMQEHSEILRLLEIHDGDGVAEVMRKHIRVQGVVYEEMLRERKPGMLRQ
ncbi:GntR family transcriptional regulator [Acidimangrovimonas sediminis]|uniref:GntR family transcriptional regulator n=1 Tax=Acidimangrovimonas sediminis TaxID=2056283 RepID=UPI000C8016B6|nr:GntR family transcriptional regulator [Acidimangrovimonas sediminis]